MPVSHPIHFNLVTAAHAAMIEHGFQPDFPAGTEAELGAIAAAPELPASAGIQDLRSLLWSSIDNDTSKDLDQIEWAEQLSDGRIRVLIGVADVDARVVAGSVIDGHAKSETTSVYTGVKVFPMLPTELSEGITSLNENQDRVALVIEFTVDATGAVANGKAYSVFAVGSLTASLATPAPSATPAASMTPPPTSTLGSTGDTSTPDSGLALGILALAFVSALGIGVARPLAARRARR